MTNKYSIIFFIIVSLFFFNCSKKQDVMDTLDESFFEASIWEGFYLQKNKKEKITLAFSKNEGYHSWKDDDNNVIKCYFEYKIISNKILQIRYFRHNGITILDGEWWIFSSNFNEIVLKNNIGLESMEEELHLKRIYN